MNAQRCQYVPFSFEFAVPAVTADEFSCGPVWSPGVLEEVSIWGSAGLWFVRLYVAALPLPQRENVGAGINKGVEPLLVKAMDGAVGFKQGSLAITSAGSGTYRLGRVVSFAPWWIWVVLENRAAAVGQCAGVVLVELAEGCAMRSWKVGRNGWSRHDPRWRRSAEIVPAGVARGG